MIHHDDESLKKYTSVGAHFGGRYSLWHDGIDCARPEWDRGGSFKDSIMFAHIFV